MIYKKINRGNLSTTVYFLFYINKDEDDINEWTYELGVYSAYPKTTNRL